MVFSSDVINTLERASRDTWNSAIVSGISSALREQVLSLIPRAEDRVRACATRNMKEALKAHVEARRAADAMRDLIARHYAVLEGSKTLPYLERLF